MFETPDDGDAKVATYEHQVKCPNARNLIAVVGDSLARPGPRVRPEVQPPDRGHGPQSQGRPDRGRPAQEGRHPRRPRRRLLPAQRVGRAGRVQRRRRRRDQRLPPAQARHRRTARTTACSPSPPTTASTSTSRRTATATPASTRARAPRATASATASRSATSTRTTTCSATRARPATARGRTTRGSTTTTPASPTTRSPPATPACRRTARSGTDNQVYSNNENYFTNDRDAYCKNTPFEKRQQEIVCPQFQVPVGSGLHPLRRQPEPHPEQRDLRQLALRRAAVLGAGLGPRRERPGQAVRHVQRQPVHPQPSWASAPAASAQPNGIDFFWDEQGIGNCWRGNQAPGGKITSDPASAAAVPPRLALPAVPTRARSPPRRPARRGIRRRSRTRPAAPGSPPRPSRGDEVGDRGDRPAPRRSGRAAARR